MISLNMQFRINIGFVFFLKETIDELNVQEK